MKPVISLVGRPNVGKSTLFNRLTRTRDALVADYPGLTRDRKYGIGRVGEADYLVVDTGGLGGSGESVDGRMAVQTRVALQESHVILLLVDGREGLTATDESIAEELRAHGKPVALVVNKTDGMDVDQACAEFHILGFGNPYPISAVHGRGVETLMTYALSQLSSESEKEEKYASQDEEAIRIAFVGRPNVGKSTLINRLLGEQRLLTFDQPGTTRDSIEVPFQRNGQHYTLIDTAGVRRRSRVRELIEKFSIVKALQAIDSAHVAILVMDARQGIAEQDARLLGLVVESGRAVVLAANKWDGLNEDDKTRLKREFDLRLSFLNYAERHMISALHGSGVGKLMLAVNRAYRSAMTQVGTAELTRLLAEAIESHPPPLVRGRRIKLRYAHQGGHNPPLFILYGNQTQHIQDAYKRYLMNFFTKALKLQGTPLRLVFKTGENPYAGRRNKLTPRQQRKRKRLLRYTRRR
jgi:GTP-binding protein